jgi:uncharacterized Zn finger protein
MTYLLAHCPMLGCNHRNVVCKLPSQAAPQFEPNVYVAVKCANCGQVFRELATRLEQSDSPVPVPQTQEGATGR